MFVVWYYHDGAKTMANSHERKSDAEEQLAELKKSGKKAGMKEMSYFDAVAFRQKHGQYGRKIAKI